ncbi:hypothetical protein D3C85_1503820 [compost metagenome]
MRADDLLLEIESPKPDNGETAEDAVAIDEDRNSYRAQSIVKRFDAHTASSIARIPRSVATQTRLFEHALNASERDALWVDTVLRMRP